MAKRRAVVYHNSDIFPISFGVVFGQKQYRGEMKRLGIPSELNIGHKCADVRTFSNKHGHEFHLVSFSPSWLMMVKPHDIAATCAHEATHVRQYAMKRIGERKPGSETEAYVTDWVAGILFEAAMKERKRRKSRKTG